MLALLQEKGAVVYRNPATAQTQLDALHQGDYSRQKTQALAVGFVSSKIPRLIRSAEQGGPDSDTLSDPQPANKKSKLDLACKRHKSLLGNRVTESELWVMLASALAQQEHLESQIEILRSELPPSRYSTTPHSIMHVEENLVSLVNAAASPPESVSQPLEDMHSSLMLYAFNGPARHSDFPGTCRAFAVWSRHVLSDWCAAQFTLAMNPALEYLPIC